MNIYNCYTREVSFLELLPQSPKTLLVNRESKFKIIQLMEFFIKEMIKTLKVFYFENKLSEFDPHVADTLCQIRAYKNWSIFRENFGGDFLASVRVNLLKLNAIKDSLKKINESFEEIKKNYSGSYNRTLDSSESIKEFAKNNNFDFTVSDDLFLLVQERLLTLYSLTDSNGVSRGLNYEKICVKANVSKSFAKKLMHHFQRNISIISSNFIFELLKDLDFEYFKDLSKVLYYLQVEDSDGRQILPCYEVTKVLLSHAVARKANILINLEVQPDMKNHKILFVKNKKSYMVKEIEKLRDQYKKPCIIIRGITNYSKVDFISKLLDLGLPKVILANMAKHPQYSAKKLEIISENPYAFLLRAEGVNKLIQMEGSIKLPEDDKINEVIAAANRLEKELLDMKELAEKNGCHDGDPRLFLVKHISCDLLENQIRNANIKITLIKNTSNILNYNVMRPLTCDKLLLSV